MASADARARASVTPGKKERLLTQPTPARVSGIADAVVIKESAIAFLCRPDGCVSGAGPHGLGLYYRDCRFLSRYELRVAGEFPEALAASGAEGFRSAFQLTNPELAQDGVTLGRQEIGIRWRHVIDIGDCALRDEIVIQNYHTREHVVPLALTFDADFADIFNIRGLVADHPGKRLAPRWEQDELVFTYEGSDGCTRQLIVGFSRTPDSRSATEARFDLRLAPQESQRLLVSLALLTFTTGASPARVVGSGLSAAEAAKDAFQRSMTEWLEGFPELESSSRRLGFVMDRSLRDLRALRMAFGGRGFYAAGVPWFMTLFGRDSLLSALQTLAYRPHVAAETIRLLAELQGRENNAWRDEQPGKILHELRVGELAQTGRVPHTPYYGTVDATPLFLIVLAEYCHWTGSLALFHEVRESVDAAMAWMDAQASAGGSGYIAYASERSGNGGLINQGWKDSGDAIVNGGGEVADPPIALVELQGYAYAARLAIANLLDRHGETDAAMTLRREASRLYERFNRDFWLEDLGFYALALCGPERAPAAVISSNAGHALWSGVVPPERAERVADRLMAEDMYSGWGIRTLSSRERAYNPVGYHLGTVWPHDNALIVAGFKRYGFDDLACRVFEGLVDAASYFAHHRLPETFAGFARSAFEVPVRYPVACHPQAWAAGSVPFMLQILLGLQPDGFGRRLRIVRPRLPGLMHQLRLRGLSVGEAEADLHFVRRGDRLSVTVERIEGELEVDVEDDG